MRFLYAALVGLHPPAYRRRFAGELLLIFDESADLWGSTSLLRDAIVSLLRQWLLREGLWKWVVAAIVGMVPLIIAFGSFLPWDRPMH